MTVITQANMEGRASVAGHGAHITAMVRSHASGDEDAFYSVALQVAAREARQGHHRLASDIKKAIDSSRQRARWLRSLSHRYGCAISSSHLSSASRSRRSSRSSGNGPF